MAIHVTAPGAEVVASWENGLPVLQFPSVRDLAEADRSVARISKGQDGAIWPTNFFSDIRRWLGGHKTVNFTEDGRQIRLGNSAVAVSEAGILIGFFDDTHPGMPYMGTPMAGLWETDDPDDPRAHGLQELWEEVVPGDVDVVGCWVKDGKLIGEDRASSYAEKHTIAFDPTLTYEVTDWTGDFPGMTIVRFGDEIELRCATAFEELTGAVELLHPFHVAAPKVPRDAEILPNGKWRDSTVQYVQSVRDFPLPLWTTKALTAVIAFGK